MTNSKHTKRALLASALSLMLCVAMLVGSTFAWFTDSVTSSGNIIKSGNLDVEMYWADGTKDPKSADTEWQDASESAIFNYEKWEPGYTEVRHIKISNVGTLALKYDVSIRAEKEVGKLAEVIDVYYIKGGKQIVDRAALKDADKIGTLADLLKEDSVANGHISGKKGDVVSSDIATIAFKMQESAGNEYQGANIGGNFSIILNATQYTEEEDSFGNDYDKDAHPTYPDGITEEDFGENIAYNNGEFYKTFTEALEANNENGGGTLYFKEDSVVDFNTHIAVTADLTIYANGADFKGRDISIGTYAEPTENETTISVYDARNLTVWGQPTNRGNVWNVNMTNCVNDGSGLLMYRGGTNTKDRINFTATNCKVNGNGLVDALHTSASGTITVKNCTFTDVDAGINIAYKCSDSMDVAVENSTFIACGKTNPADDYFAPVRFVNNWLGDLTVSLKNNTFADTIGTNGDILLGDYRSGKLSFALTCEIVTEEDVMLKNSKEAAHPVGSGTYEIEK